MTAAELRGMTTDLGSRSPVVFTLPDGTVLDLVDKQVIPDINTTEAGKKEFAGPPTLVLCLKPRPKAEEVNGHPTPVPGKAIKIVSEKGFLMARVWLILDVSSLAHRAMHSTGDLTHGGNPTGTLFGILREARSLADRFQTEHFVWCFDHGKGLREQEFPSYKLTRRMKKRPEAEEQARERMREQVNGLRTKYLEELGYENALFQDGYEADDLIAAAVKALPKKDRAVLVSGDKDLYQLLKGPAWDNVDYPNVVDVYHPQSKKLITRRVFFDEYKINPVYWPSIKAIAGCGVDDVHGIRGVGEITAARFHWDESLPAKTSQKINKFLDSRQYTDNIKMVRLPYPGTKEIELIAHAPPTAAAWDGLCRRLGMTSLIGRGPG